MRYLPNIICLFRIGLVWPVVDAIWSGEFVRALALFVLAGASDGLDGYLAKRFGWQSALGKVLDPLADKLLLVAIFIETTWLGLVPWWLTAAAVARDVMIGLGAIIFSLWFGPLKGRPTIPSKLNTLAQLGLLMAVILRGATGFPPEPLIEFGAVVTFCTTVVSGLHYLLTFTRRAWSQPVRSI
jgi:cardiolipin synthase (CMP-forming)